MGIYCGHCGYWMDSSAKKCPNCGKRRKSPFSLPIIAVLLLFPAVVLTGIRWFSQKHPEPEPAAQTKQLSQVREYDSRGNLRIQYDFLYEEDLLTLVQTTRIEEDGRIAGISSVPIEYDAEGRLTQTMCIGDGATRICHYVYDSDGRCLRKDVYSYLDEELYGDRSNYDLQVYQYRYDSQGNLIEIDGDNERTVYTYDDQGRIVKEAYEFVLGRTYVTTYDYEYKLFTLCSISYLSENAEPWGCVCTAELRYADTCPVWIFCLPSESVVTGDAEGYLSRVRTLDGSRVIDFLYT